MKKMFKKLICMMMLLVTCFSTVMVANAETASKKLTITSYDQANIPISFPATFRVKKTSDGKYSYCTYYAKSTPSSGVTYTRGSLITDNGLNYILKKAYSASNDQEFFIYQTAMWVYMVDKGMMQGPYYDLTVFKSQINSSSSDTATKIKNIVSAAKSASANSTTAPTITVSTSGDKFTLDSTGKYYVSSKIKVTSSTGKYKVTFTSAPEGTTSEKDGNHFIIKVPASKVTNLKTTVKFKVSNSKAVYSSYYYNPSNSTYQIMATTFKQTKTASDTASLKITKTASLAVLKVDESENAISGAKMQVLNSSGKVIDGWTSTTEAHTVDGLAAGTYTLKEIAAPTGYALSTVQTKFTVGSDGKIKDSSGKEIVELKYANKKTSITISKQDITNKEELPGAKLVIKNASGKEIISWTSSDKKYVIKGLAAGTYTLTETIAPEGYSLSTETITFKIDEYGTLYNGSGTKVDSIVMYNTPTKTQDLSISKRDITTNKELAGAKLVLKDASGNVVDSWTSETTDHVIKDMKAGTYTLSETVAPNGYVLSTETITFKIDAEGKLYDQNGNSIDKVIMYNQPEEKTGGVSISKQDITNGEELPGATLVVKDYDGNEIESWVSTNTPHIIEDLKPGIYTLTETVAPEGYILSTETITFTVKDDGTVTKVVMYNTPDSKEVPEDPVEVPVENTGSFKTITSSLVGVAIMISGLVMVLKNTKKKEN